MRLGVGLASKANPTPTPTPNPTPNPNQVQQQVREEVSHLKLGSATLDQLYACPLLQGVMYEVSTCTLVRF